jgi:hypothetical protein
MRRDFVTDTLKRLEFEKELSVNKNAQASSDFLTGTTPVTDDQSIQAGLEKVLRDSGVQLSQPVTKYLSFFERQTAAALEQGREITKASLAGYENAGPRQKENRNLQPVGEALAEMGADKALREGDVAKCKRYCKQQGRTSCRNCGGEGYDAHTARVGKSVNKARHLSKGGTELAPVEVEYFPFEK